ncbi:Na/Pi cotransporter family protein [Salisediminibacterium selenitireducens]|uniref:Na+/Picotransporter n=1 Tax=Bacillus selenitireducens (strain ATCC 700615 / DSM 15326 / MLS10) TaxID=439292 RepID=D6XUL9_BACIE|nr:Na/Pi symporter [Salisediminibacterium selenitireducens]ADH99505.1 Na+/Picotransporter [[Bacillus] selenitireducens MLS10]
MQTAGLILGGIGLFLFGMQLMTESLKEIAGERLKNLLAKFTGGVVRSIFSGAFVTALIQSSSATTFMTIGFVSAGLLTFSQSAGVIIGANLGSTSTGWIVSVIGFQINMTLLAMPLIGGGVLINVLTRQRYKAPLFAAIGFGFLFLGIDTLQSGMSGFADGFDLSSWTGDGGLWMILLIAVGILMTVVMQSSSAAVVTTITALHTGTIDFYQAALLVIGQNVGTTVKALIASIGASTPARQTAAAHILFNLLTGAIAFLSLNIMVDVVLYASAWAGITEVSIQLALFHTLFNITGVVVILFIYPWFLKLVKSIVRDSDEQDTYTKYLDASVAEIGPVATEAVNRALHAIVKDSASLTAQVVESGEFTSNHRVEIGRIRKGLTSAEQFLSDLSSSEPPAGEEEYQRRLALIHVIDHTKRLLNNLHLSNERYQGVSQADPFTDLKRSLIENAKAVSSMESVYINEIIEETEANALYLAEQRKELRKVLIEKAAGEEKRVEEGLDMIQGIQWLDRVQYHLWRAVHHLTSINS